MSDFSPVSAVEQPKPPVHWYTRALPPDENSQLLDVLKGEFSYGRLVCWLHKQGHPRELRLNCHDYMLLWSNIQPIPETGTEGLTPLTVWDTEIVCTECLSEKDRTELVDLSVMGLFQRKGGKAGNYSGPLKGGGNE